MTMDKLIPTDDAEIERHLMARAVEEAIRNPAPGRPHSEVRVDLLKRIAQLDRKIARLLEE